MSMRKLISFLLVCVLLASCSMFAISSSADTISFVTKTSNGKIYGIAVGSVVKDVQLAYYNSVVVVYNKNGNRLSSDAKVGTGCIVKINGVSYVAVVMGDADGDGDLDAADYIAIKRSYLGTGYVGSLGHEAVGVASGGEVKAINYIMVKRAVLGTYDINRAYNCEPYNPAEGEPDWTPGWS